MDTGSNKSTTKNHGKNKNSQQQQHHDYYACDAAQLLETCREHLQTVMELDVQENRGANRALLLELQSSLETTERLLQHYFVRILPPLSNNDNNDNHNKELPSLKWCVTSLRRVMQDEKQQNSPTRQQRQQQQQQQRQQPSISNQNLRNGRHAVDHHQHNHHHGLSRTLSDSMTTHRSVTDLLLFRLIVALQLCLVRIDDAHFVVTGVRRNDSDTAASVPSKQGRGRRSYFWLRQGVLCGTVLGVTAYLWQPKQQHQQRPVGTSSTIMALQQLLLVDQKGQRDHQRDFLQTLAKVGTSVFLGYQLLLQWKVAWMTSKLRKSNLEIQEWHQQWYLVEGNQAQFHSTATSSSEPTNTTNPFHGGHHATTSDAAKARRLIEYAQQRHQTPPRGTSPSASSSSSSSSSFWVSDGELRFLIVRKALEAYYSWTNDDGKQLSSDARALIQNSWGLVSRPGFKSFSLKWSRLLKGASVADRIEIAGVPCFVISKYPCPELATAIQQYQRKGLPRRLSCQLSTIDEDAAQHHDSGPSLLLLSQSHNKLFAGQKNKSCRQQDIILHCTGGGFFAHMIAFDLVYLLDWSASTGAVVVCPEFSLLPSNPFPTALHEITTVYTALVSGDATSALGVEVRSIAVTGESTGANLAAALCVNLCLGERQGTQHARPPSTTVPPVTTASAAMKDDGLEGMANDQDTSNHKNDSVRMPDALMLSCAVLNMSLELSHSRVMGTEDPVLPSGVLSAISDAYIPPNVGIRKTHILASPLFAPSSILARFPPTLLFASSKDPLLDDSVEFNQRLRSLDVDSEIRAVQNMPHAFWGLGMAGFPEAKQVHKEAQAWLATKLLTQQHSQG